MFVYLQFQTSWQETGIGPATLPLIAIAVSISALTVALLNYRRKSSQRMRGSFGWASGQDHDVYISSVTIENLKDRAVTIFGIYLQVEHHYYIELERFESKPLVLRAYETWHEDYGPIDFYAVSSRKIDMNRLLSDRGFRKHIVLSTADGKYRVRNPPKRWSPVSQYFSNSFTVPATPVRLYYKGKTIGGGAKYIVDVVTATGASEIITVYPRDYEVQIFREFKLTQESLEGRTTLINYLESQRKDGKLNCSTFEVVEVDTLRKRQQGFDHGDAKEAKPLGFFVYYILGPLVTRYRAYKTSKRNRINPC